MDSIKKLIRCGESEILEFKKSTQQLKPALQTLCAFLNHKGGNILIGVNQEGHLAGQNVTDNTRQEIAKVLTKIEPPVSIDVEYHLLENNKYIINLLVPTGPYIPYTYEGRAYQRIQSTTSIMPQHLYEQLLIRRSFNERKLYRCLAAFEINKKWPAY